jgi:hypothetical protein
VKSLQFFGISEGERPDGIFQCRKEKDTVMYRKEIFGDNTYWIYLTLVMNQMETAVNKVKTRGFHKVFEIS